METDILYKLTREDIRDVAALVSVKIMVSVISKDPTLCYPEKLTDDVIDFLNRKQKKES